MGKTKKKNGANFKASSTNSELNPLKNVKLNQSSNAAHAKFSITKDKNKVNIETSATVNSDETSNSTKESPSVKQFKTKQNSTNLAAQSTEKSKSATKRPSRHNPNNKVIYINSNYVGNDPDGIGALIQNELIGLRQQSTAIKTASDLTESQAHVIKRQITRLHGGVKKTVHKRPKKFTMSIGDAAKELKLMLEKQQNS